MAARVQPDMSIRTPARSAADYLPPEGRRTLPQLRAAAQSCRGCDLYKNATQAVFGEGPRRARVLMLGEQPGDQEDLAGHPFVGPAGRVLDRALTEAGIDRELVFVTNAVKHFKWKPRGKRRIHAGPTAGEVRACKPWLIAEVMAVKPRLIVCLGATAARSLLGPKFRITVDHGRIHDHELGPRVMATIHPSAVLRMPEKAEREAAFAGLVADLAAAKGELAA